MTHSGFLGVTNATSPHSGQWNLAAAFSGTQSVNNNTGSVTVGGQAIAPGGPFTNGEQIINTGYMEFDTTAQSKVFSATLLLHTAFAQAGESWNLHIAVYDYGSAVDATDWRIPSVLVGMTVIGSISGAALVAAAAGSGIASVVLDPLAINLGGLTRLVLFSDKLANNTPPADGHACQVLVNDALTADLVLTTSPVGLASLKVEMGFGYTTLDPAAVLTDVTGDVMSIQIDRGRTNEVDQVSTGTCTIVLINDDYAYDPNNNANVIPLVQVRVSMVDNGGTSGVQRRRYLFSGFVGPRGGWTLAYGPGNKGGANASTASAACVEFQGVISLLPNIANVDSPGAPKLGIHPSLSSVEMAAALRDDAHLPTPPFSHYYDGFNAILSGWQEIVNYGKTLVQPFFGGVNAFSYLQSLAKTEGGQIYSDAGGVIWFDYRYASYTRPEQITPVAVFDDSGAGISFANTDYSRAYSALLYNWAFVTGPSGVIADAFDAGSIHQYAQSFYSQTDGLFNSDEDAQSRAQFVRDAYASPLFYPATMRIYPTRPSTGTHSILDAALRLDLFYRVTVKFKPPGAGAQLTRDLFIGHIAHAIDLQKMSWVTTYGFEPCDRFESIVAQGAMFKLDDAALGKLDGTRQLGY